MSNSFLRRVADVAIGACIMLGILHIMNANGVELPVSLKSKNFTLPKDCVGLPDNSVFLVDVDGSIVPRPRAIVACGTDTTVKTDGVNIYFTQPAKPATK